MFLLADALSTVPYAPSRIIFNVRKGNWDVVERLLKDESRLRASDDAVWISDFIAGIRYVQTGFGDQQTLNRAVAAFAEAIEREYLNGQYIYGGWVLLGQTELAIEAAFRLADPDYDADEFDVEFLFVHETRTLRHDRRFGELLDNLGLREYWRKESFCPEIFLEEGETDWCSEPH
jgi:hypothetical protein